jgi:hypothetical protein
MCRRCDLHSYGTSKETTGEQAQGGCCARAMAARGEHAPCEPRTYQALELWLYEIMKVESVMNVESDFGGLYSAAALLCRRAVGQLGPRR